MNSMECMVQDQRAKLVVGEGASRESLFSSERSLEWVKREPESMYEMDSR